MFGELYKSPEKNIPYYSQKIKKTSHIEGSLRSD